LAVGMLKEAGADGLDRVGWEQHAEALEHAVAYFNVDCFAVSGPEFTAAAVPSLRQFVREVTRARA